MFGTFVSFLVFLPSSLTSLIPWTFPLSLSILFFVRERDSLSYSDLRRIKGFLWRTRNSRLRRSRSIHWLEPLPLPVSSVVLLSFLFVLCFLLQLHSSHSLSSLVQYSLIISLLFLFLSLLLWWKLDAASCISDSLLVSWCQSIEFCCLSDTKSASCFDMSTSFATSQDRKLEEISVWNSWETMTGV